ncbi:hypothetical protein LS74_009020 [Helicobacter magdeburgensis]|uniref:Uncharacterized protein n=1 Tax=Helicobacter magdeburgensis TaxID=471858 RepID=A0A4U8SWQ8_9HELI|nr:hypothetical protein [Helicobacter magdeburgensis]TLD91374.1 hypothetical protein LS74_009020 [Helicobacter magdeburgensis]
MPKKILCVSLSLCAILYAAPTSVPTQMQQQGQKSQQQEYGRGWLKYDDESKQPQNQPQQINPKATEKDLLIAILQEQKIANRIQMEMLEIMKVVHDLPRMVEVNGKKCLSNSSEDCFVMPIIGDGARIPVMRKWLENPTVENALAYYKWQSKYLNHVFNAGYSLEAAAKNTRYPFAATPPHLTMEDGQGQDERKKMVKEKLKQHSPNMEVAILMGKNYGYDIENIVLLREVYDEIKSMGVKTRFVFESQEALNRFNNLHEKALGQDASDLWRNIPNTDKVISPNSFKNDKIDTYMTPMYIFRYRNVSNQKSFNQVIGIGRDRPKDIINMMTRSMILFGVIKPEELAGTHAQKQSAEGILKQINSRHFLNDEEAKQRAPELKKLIEEEMQK